MVHTRTDFCWCLQLTLSNSRASLPPNLLALLVFISGHQSEKLRKALLCVPKLVTGLNCKARIIIPIPCMLSLASLPNSKVPSQATTSNLATTCCVLCCQYAQWNNSLLWTGKATPMDDHWNMHALLHMALHHIWQFYHRCISGNSPKSVTGQFGQFDVWEKNRAYATLLDHFWFHSSLSIPEQPLKSCSSITFCIKCPHS